MRRFYQLIQKNLLFDKLSEIFPQKKSEVGSPSLITISREKGSGGRLIAYLVAKKLGKPWLVYHKDIIDKIAKESKLEKNLIEEMDEKNIPFIEKIVDDFFGRRYLSLSSYHKHLAKILTIIAQQDHAIIIGRGADFLFPQALKIRVICEMEQRIAWEMEYEKLSRIQAVNRIEKSDRERTDFIKTVYNHDQRKAHHYDLVIRTGPHLSIENASSLIVMAAKKRFKI